MRRNGAAARPSQKRRAQVIPHPRAQPPAAVSLAHQPLFPEMDDEDYERRRSECVSEMLDLEKQFSELKEK